MQHLEPELMGHILNAVSETTSEQEYMETVLATYRWAYEISHLEPHDAERLKDIMNRLNAFQRLREDKDFEAVFEAGKNKVFGDIAYCLVNADYVLDEQGLASFDNSEVISMFLSIQREKAN